MAVTRLKRKNRRNKVVAKQKVKFIKMATDLEAGSRSKMPKDSQIVKNNEILNELANELKK